MPITTREALALAGVSLARALGLSLIAIALGALLGQAHQESIRSTTALAWIPRLHLSASVSVLLGLLGALLRGAASHWGPLVSARISSAVALRQRRRLVAARLGESAPERDLDDVALAAVGMRDLTPYFSQFIPAAVHTAVIPPTLLLVMGLTDWVSALTVALTLPLIPVFMILIGQHTRDRTAKLSQALSELSTAVGELARGLSVLVSLGQAGRQRQGLAKLSKRYRETTMASLRTAFLSSLALEMIATLSVALVAVVIGIRLLHGSMGLEAGLIVLILAPECYAPLRDVGTAFHAAEDGQLALTRSEAAISGASSMQSVGIGAENSAFSPPIPTLPAGVLAQACGDLVRVSSGPESLAASDMDFSLPEGSGLTALTGPSGCGKSSLISWLANGAPIVPSGDDVARAPEQAGSGLLLRGSGGVGAHRIIAVSQTPAFLEPTLAEALWLFAPNAPAEDVSRLARTLGLAEVLNAPLAELSPGEQRRASLLRALAVNAEAIAGFTDEQRHRTLFVADEPTAQLDPNSAEAVSALLLELARTQPVLVVTHDLDLAAQGQHQWRMGAPGAPVSVASGSYQSAPHGARADRAQPDTVVQELPEPKARAAGNPAAPTAAQGWLNPTMVTGWALGLFSALCAVALTTLSGWLIVTASYTSAIMYLSVAIVGVRAFGLFRAVARYGERVLTHDGILASAEQLRLRLWDALTDKPWNFRRISRSSTAASTLVSTVDAIRDAHPRAMVPLISALGIHVGAFVTVLFLAPQICWLPVALIVLTAAVVFWVNRLDRTGTAALAEHTAWLTQRLTALYAAAADIRGLGAQERVLSRLDEREQKQVRIQMQVARSRGWGAGTLVAAYTAAALLPAVLLPNAAGSQGALPLQFKGALCLMFLAVLEFSLAALDVLPQHRTVAQGRAVLDAVFAEDDASAYPRISLAEPARSGEGRTSPADPNGHLPSGLSAELTVRDIGPVAIHAAPDQWAVLTGPSGGGKSTMLEALAGFLPASGAVSLSGEQTVIEQPTLLEIPQTAWAGQEALLFDGPVASNLRLAAPHASEDELRTALTTAGLPHMDLDRAVGPGGSFLSGGERRRVALARTLLTDAQIYLLDEPTAHLDHEGAVSLLADTAEALAGKTVVLVSHEGTALLPDSTARNVQQVAVG